MKTLSNYSNTICTNCGKETTFNSEPYTGLCIECTIKEIEKEIGHLRTKRITKHL